MNKLNHPLTTLALPSKTVAGVSFAWTVIISVMRGALGDGAKAAAPAPSSAALEEAVVAVAAAAAEQEQASAARQPTTASANVLVASPAHHPTATGLKALVSPSRASAVAEATP